MFDKDQLISFLVEAKKSTYAAGDLAQKIIESDKSTTLILILEIGIITIIILEENFMVAEKWFFLRKNQFIL